MTMLQLTKNEDLGPVRDGAAAVEFAALAEEEGLEDEAGDGEGNAQSMRAVALAAPRDRGEDEPAEEGEGRENEVKIVHGGGREACGGRVT